MGASQREVRKRGLGSLVGTGKNSRGGMVGKRLHLRAVAANNQEDQFAWTVGCTKTVHNAVQILLPFAVTTRRIERVGSNMAVLWEEIALWREHVVRLRDSPEPLGCA